MSQQSLKDKTIKGTMWSAIETGARYGISFLVGIVLARLLSPEEYGLIGILTIFINFFNVIVDGGFTNAIIRKQDAKDTDYCTVFYINFVVSALLCVTLFLCAPLIAHYFERDELVRLTQVMSLAVLINGLGIVQKAKLTKAIDFKSQTKISLTASFTSGIVGIAMAATGFGVWALVAQQLTQLSLNTILLWLSTKWVPKLLFSLESFRDLWSFGWKLLVSGILDSLSTEVTHAVVGKCYSPITLGKYTRAKQFADIFSSSLTTVIQRVTYPVLSAIQDDTQRLKEAYRLVIKVTCLPTFVLMMCLAAIARSMILVLLGEQWVECANYLQIICFYTMLYPLHALNLNAIQVMGRSDITLRIKLMKTFLQLIPIILGVIFNIYWMLLASILTGLISYYLNAFYSKPLLNYGIWEQIMDVLPSFLLALCIALPVYCIGYLPIKSIYLLTLQVIMGAVLGLSVLEYTHLPEYMEIKTIVKKK